MRAINVAVAAVAGLAFWYFVAPLYAPATRALAAAAVPAMFGRGYQLGGADDPVLYTPAGLIAARVFMRYVTANLITLIALFGLAKKPLAMSNIARCAVAIACLVPVHAAAILVVAKSFVVPPDSLWRNAAQAYTIFGCHAISFALWSLLRPSDTASASASDQPKGRKTAAKR
jgi:hypothetical protein